MLNYTPQYNCYWEGRKTWPIDSIQRNILDIALAENITSAIKKCYRANEAGYQYQSTRPPRKRQAL